MEIKINIFYLDRDPKTCAQMHNDKHVVKMILEYAQLLSTAHRILDGKLVEGLSKSGRKAKRYELPDQRDSVLYTATHANHPSAVWARKSRQNYFWLFSLFSECLDEYSYRYGKQHATTRLYDSLYSSPNNISVDQFAEPPPAMPDDYKVAGDSVTSYRNYYLGDKVKMSRWTNREMPLWFADGINTLYDDACFIEHKPKLNRFISMPLQYANI
jgi:hypothetical protein